MDTGWDWLWTQAEIGWVMYQHFNTGAMAASPHKHCYITVVQLWPHNLPMIDMRIRNEGFSWFLSLLLHRSPIQLHAHVSAFTPDISTVILSAWTQFPLSYDPPHCLSTIQKQDQFTDLVIGHISSHSIQNTERSNVALSSGTQQRYPLQQRYRAAVPSSGTRRRYPLVGQQPLGYRFQCCLSKDQRL